MAELLGFVRRERVRNVVWITFGTLDVDHRSLAPTARLHDVAGRVLYSVELPARL